MILYGYDDMKSFKVKEIIGRKNKTKEVNIASDKTHFTLECRPNEWQLRLNMNNTARKKMEDTKKPKMCRK
jgi:hypothetical protein